MLDIDCAICGRTLIGPRRIVSVTATGDGMRVAYVCWCGRHGDEIVRRRRAPRGAATAPRPVAPAVGRVPAGVR